MRAAEVGFIHDCAEMAARASLYRTESRWGLYHYRVDHPQRNDADWFVHTELYKNDKGEIAHRKHEIEPYSIPIDTEEGQAYSRLRIQKDKGSTESTQDKQAVAA